MAEYKGILNPVPKNRGGYEVNYSTTEHEIGTWIDGSVLYEKTIECGALPDATAKTIAHGISNIKDIVDTSGNFTNGTYWFPLNNPNPTSLNGQVQVYSTLTNIFINTARDLSNFSRSWVTLRYTKTA